MVAQKEIDLNSPLNADAPASLSKTSLTPELTNAALVLHGDNFKQSQAKLSRYILVHPIAITLYTVACPLVIARSLWDYIEISDNLIEFYQILMRNKTDFVFCLFSALPMLAAVFGCFGMLAYILGDELGSITNKFIAQRYCDHVFGFDVKKFANVIDGNSSLAALGKNTEIVVYRDSPIAIATIKPDYEQSTKDNLIVKITGIHVRKVFQKVDFDQMLIEWAVLRSRELYQEYLKSKKITSGKTNGSILITMDAYSFDKQGENLLIKNGFKLLNKSIVLNPYDSKLNKLQKSIHQFLGLTKDSFGLLLTTDSEDVELIKDSSLLRNENSAKRRA
ncbi:PHO86 [Candida oxycetoniae]|uniref:PHO86 n=1 Tax=Candida oxycetoniae TaxID=497107 RepID=A0AAI9SZZ8_9ASCO|nr:PHO86 [Candida oxycetoniae]KAI3406321.2 PHO86 [Candida oxycetoniae]